MDRSTLLFGVLFASTSCRKHTLFQAGIVSLLGSRLIWFSQSLRFCGDPCEGGEMSFWFCPPRVHCSVLARVTSTLKVYVSVVGRGEPSVTGIEQQKVGFVFVFFIKLL